MTPPPIFRIELGWQAKESGSLQRLVKSVLWESQVTVGTEDSTLGNVVEGSSCLWNSVEGNRDSEKGSKVKPDVVICMEGGLAVGRAEQGHCLEGEMREETSVWEYMSISLQSVCQRVCV